ncbi:MAG: hypothetical protein R3E79_45050 [Caldilineaceae bacterium]
MKKFILPAIGLCIAYFVVGWIAVQVAWLPNTQYHTYAIFVGIFASLLGWLAYVLPESAESAERRVAEAEVLRTMAQTIEGQTRQGQVTADTGERHPAVAVKKDEIEALVRKASLLLFLHDQVARNQARIVPMVESNQELSQLLADTRSLKKDLAKLGEEVAADPNVDFLNDIIERENMRDRYSSLAKWEKYLLISLKYIGQMATAFFLRPRRK